jgi:hypothetical protein
MNLQQWLGYLLAITAIIFLGGCTSAMKQTGLPTSSTISPLTTLPQSPTLTDLGEVKTHFEQIIPGVTTRSEVLKLMGEPDKKFVMPGNVDWWWYNPPQGAVYFGNDVVIRTSVALHPLGEIIAQQGSPERVVIHVVRDQHVPRITTTYLLYPESRTVLIIPEDTYSLSSKSWVDETKFAPNYYEEYLKDVVLLYDSHTITVTETTWPGFLATPNP